MINLKELDTTKFYHITDDERVNSVVSRGLRPSFDHQMYAKEKQTFLEAVYMFHPNNLDVPTNFLKEYDTDELAVFEIDLLQLSVKNFYADEDYFDYHAPEEVTENAFKYDTRFDTEVPVREVFQEYVNESIKEHGTVAYQGIVPPYALDYLSYEKFVENQRKNLKSSQLQELTQEHTL